MYRKLNHVLLYFTAALLFVSIAAVCACKTTQFDPAEAEGILTNYTGCKNNAAARTMLPETGTASPRDGLNQECISYQYNGGNTLIINHLNTVLNCCPVEILADITITADGFQIIEKEKEKNCKCNCFYDLDFCFYHIPPGVYTLTITCANGVIRQYTFNLETELTGTMCWDSQL